MSSVTKSKSRIHKESGSPFDRTVAVSTRPGTHSIETRPVDASAFSFSKVVKKPSPKAFMKNGTGRGGVIGGDFKGLVRFINCAE